MGNQSKSIALLAALLAISGNLCAAERSQNNRADHSATSDTAELTLGVPAGDPTAGSNSETLDLVLALCVGSKNSGYPSLTHCIEALYPDTP